MNTDERRFIVTTTQLFRFLGTNGLRRMLQSQGILRTQQFDEESDEEIGYTFGSHGLRRRRRQRPSGDLYPKVPSDAGRELMASGIYGNNPYYVDKLKHRRRKLATKLMWREMGIGPRGADYRASHAIFQVGTHFYSTRLYPLPL